MQTEIILAGFGGQGVLFAGQLLAYTGMDSGYHVTWIPSYGPEMRGGTANCTVIIADEEIGSPTIRNPKGAAVFNLPSLDKYEPLVSSGGVLIANASLITRDIKRSDIVGVMIPANKIAESLGSRRLTNMVMLGALLTELPVLTIEQLEEGLKNHIPERHRNMLEANFNALRTGHAYLKSERVPTN